MNQKRKNFIKKTEDFTCENCGTFVEGKGFENHCPKCLYSKHVDDEIPGDRISLCHGLMEPIGIRKKGGKIQIKHRCMKCGEENFCKISKNDDQDILRQISLSITPD